MSHSRNFQRSRKGIDEVREHITREALLKKNAQREELDRAPIELPCLVKDNHTLNICDRWRRLRILFTGETAHVEYLS